MLLIGWIGSPLTGTKKPIASISEFAEQKVKNHYNISVEVLRDKMLEVLFRCQDVVASCIKFYRVMWVTCD